MIKVGSLKEPSLEVYNFSTTETFLTMRRRRESFLLPPLPKGWMAPWASGRAVVVWTSPKSPHDAHENDVSHGDNSSVHDVACTHGC